MPKAVYVLRSDVTLDLWLLHRPTKSTVLFVGSSIRRLLDEVENTFKDFEPV